MAYAFRALLEEMIGRNVPIKEVVDSKKVFDEIARNGMTGEK